MSASKNAIVALLALTTIATSADRSAAREVWREGFETPKTSWQLAGGDAQCRVIRHQRLRTESHSGNGCEWLQIEGAGGSYVYAAHYVDRPPVIEELSPRVWIKSDRVGLRIAARIVLPRTVDSRTGRPATVVILGESYAAAGRWQQLRLEGIPRLLTRQIHILRMQIGPQVDEREAYLDAVLLNVYGGPGATNVWIDDLEVLGHATTGKTGDDRPTAQPEATDNWASRGIVRLPSANSTTAAGPRHSIKLVGGVLLVDDRPVFPRAIQHCGEPLTTLKRLGFNAVWLQRLPAPELLEEAERLGLWLICPPPRPVGEADLAEITPSLDRVLVWNLGDNLSEAELDAARRWAEKVCTADRRGHRPIICRPKAELRGYSRAADLLLLDRRPLCTGMEFTDYATWVRRQPLLASPGTPVWTTVQTQPGEALRDQLSALAPDVAPPSAVAPEQIRLLAYTAVSAGSRGLLFLSDSPLDAADADSQRRAAALELLNLELELIEPWAAAGKYSATVDTTQPEIVGSVLRVDRARMVLPVWSSPGSQCMPSESAALSLPLIVPGVPEAGNAYLFTPAGVKPLRRKRVAGGVCVSLDEFDLTAQILVAHDPAVVGAVHRRVSQSGRRMVELHREVASRELNAARSIANRLAARRPVKDHAKLLASAQKYLQDSTAKLAANDYSGAVLAADRSLRSLRSLKRSYWDAARRGLASTATSPAALAFETLPTHWRMIDRLAAGRFEANMLAGGDFEDVGAMMQAGWQNIFQAEPTLRTSVDLAPQAARSGKLGLRMTAAAIDQRNPSAALERPPVILTSPTVNVPAGTIVCIHGWACVPKQIEAGADGLLIFDSIAGEELADRIGRTDGWRQFALYRVASRSGAMRVTFALSGLGEAWLDDVAVQCLVPASTRGRAVAQR